MICIIDCGTSWIEEIKNNVKKNNHLFTVIKLNKIKDYEFNLFQGLIISGAPIILTKANIKEYLNLFQFIKEINVPILGICFGHQIIGLLHGSKITIGKKIDKKEQIEIIQENHLFKEIKNKSFFKEEHSESISLPNDFILLARSKSDNNETMKHFCKKVYGTQFHPEVSGNNGEKLLSNFLETCEKK